MIFKTVKGNKGWESLTPEEIKSIQMIACTAVEDSNVTYTLDPDLKIGNCDANCGRQIYYRVVVPNGPPKVCNHCLLWITDCRGEA